MLVCVFTGGKQSVHGLTTADNMQNLKVSHLSLLDQVMKASHLRVQHRNSNSLITFTMFYSINRTGLYYSLLLLKILGVYVCYIVIKKHTKMNCPA